MKTKVSDFTDKSYERTLTVLRELDTLYGCLTSGPMENHLTTITKLCYGVDVLRRDFDCAILVDILLKEDDFRHAVELIDLLTLTTVGADEER